MQNRWPIIAASLVVSLFLLFGGFFAYQKLQIEGPMERAISSTSHIEKHTLDIRPDRITVQVTPDPDFSLQRDYMPLRKKLTEISGGRELAIRLGGRSEGELDDAWNRMDFGVREGITLKRYTQIPRAVEGEAEDRKIRTRVFMDEEYVYIELKKGNQRLYRVLPLHKPASEVKDNG